MNVEAHDFGSSMLNRYPKQIILKSPMLNGSNTVSLDKWVGIKPY